MEDAERRFGDPTYMEELAASIAPELARDDDLLRWLHRTWKLAGASPAGVAMFRRMNLEIDVRAVLPTIAVPTLVLQRADDPFFPVAAGRYVASLIPGAEYEELEGNSWVPWFGGAASLSAAVQAALGRPPVDAPKCSGSSVPRG